MSLEDNFNEGADALVGMAMDVDRCCSTTYTFDLTRRIGSLAAEEVFTNAKFNMMSVTRSVHGHVPETRVYEDA